MFCSLSSSIGDDSKILSLLSWNIDGRDERYIKERTEFVCDLILSNRPHVVFLQEVEESTWGPVIVARLGQNYSCYCPSKPPLYYYNAILILKDNDDVRIAGDLQMYDFCSTMGRHILRLPIRFSGVDLEVMTSHLESLYDFRKTRASQLNVAFTEMVTLQESNKVSIFGGDLNIGDDEIESIGVPTGIIDVWEACGSPEEHRYTWDVSENDNLDWWFKTRPRKRVDRIYVSPSDGVLQPKSFQLVGKERLKQCGRFPSDHWGMMMEFKFKKTH